MGLFIWIHFKLGTRLLTASGRAVGKAVGLAKSVFCALLSGSVLMRCSVACLRGGSLLKGDATYTATQIYDKHNVRKRNV